MPSRCCIQYVSKSGRPSSGHRTGKGWSSSRFPRRVVPKDVLTFGQLHSSLMLVRSCLKSCMRGLSIMWTKNFQMSKLGLEKEEKPEIKLPTFAGLQRKQGNFRKTSLSVSSTLKPLTVWVITNCGKLLKRWESQTILPVFSEGSMQVKKKTVRTLHEITDWFKIEKGVQQGFVLSTLFI